MGLFKDIESERAATDRTPFARAGHYLARIDRMREGEGQVDGIGYVAFDLTVLHVYPDGETPKTSPQNEPRKWTDQGEDGWHKPGQEMTVFYKASWKSAQANLKAFIANAAGLEDHDVTEEACAKISANKLLEGEVVELQNRVVEIKKSGAPFTRIWCVRRVEGAEYCNIVSDEVAAKFFPDGFDAGE